MNSAPHTRVPISLVATGGAALFGVICMGSLGVYPTTSVIQGSPLFMWGVSLWEALILVSQKWSFPTALLSSILPWSGPSPFLGM